MSVPQFPRKNRFLGNWASGRGKGRKEEKPTRHLSEDNKGSRPKFYEVLSLYDLMGLHQKKKEYHITKTKSSMKVKLIRTMQEILVNTGALEIQVPFF